MIIADTLSQESGSFRDPSGYVFTYQGRLLRLLDDQTMDMLAILEKSGWLEQHAKQGNIARTSILSPPEQERILKQLSHTKAAGIIEHERLPVQSYPYEWSFSMLADAGLLHLKLQEELLDHRLSLKDASAFNVIFNKTTPCFIDMGSIERPARFDVWYAYGQFCRMFLFPLLLKIHRGIPIPGMFMPDLNGIDILTCYKAMGLRKAWSWRCFLDVGLQRVFHNPDKTPAKSLSVQQSVESQEVQKFNLRRLRGVLRQLKKAYRPDSVWNDYSKTHSYTVEAEAEKVEFIENILRKEKPVWVHDIGCNTGAYSRLAAAQGCKVIASDNDHDSIECLYRELQEKPAEIYPIVANIAAPSPGAGYLGIERKSLLDRIQPDAVMALAIVHHLMVTSRLTLPMLADLFAKLTRQLLIIEYIDPSDEMFKKLLAFRTDDFSSLTLESFLTALSRHFNKIASREVKPGKRWILALQLRK